MNRCAALGLSGLLLIAIGVGAWAIPVAQAQSSSAAVATGWWSRQPLARPLEAGRFEVSWAAEQEQSLAAVRFEAPVAPGSTVYLVLTESGGSATDQGLVEVCPTEDQWAPANPGPYAERPTARCAPGSGIVLGRDGGALQWVGDVTAAAQGGGTLAYVVRPLGKPLSAGFPATVPFSVQFSAAALRIEPSGGESTATTVPTPVDFGETGGSSGSFGGGSGFPDLEDGSFTPQLPPVAPNPTEEVATPTLSDKLDLGPVDVVADDSKPWGRIVVLTPISAGLGALTAAGRRWLLDRQVARLA